MNNNNNVKENKIIIAIGDDIIAENKEFDIAKLSNYDLGRILSKVRVIKDLIADIEKEATRRASEECVRFDGYFLREGATRQYFANEPEIVRILEENGIDPWQPKKLRTVASVKKEIGEKLFKELIPFVITEKGNTCLVEKK